MLAEKRREILKKLKLSNEFGSEIEEYIQWQNDNLFEPTNLFARVRANLHGDTPEAWTAVQVFIYLLIRETEYPEIEKLAVVYMMAFPTAKDKRKKSAWIDRNSGMLYLIILTILALCLIGESFSLVAH